MSSKFLLLFWFLALCVLFYVLPVKADTQLTDYSFKYGMGLLDGSPTGNIKQFSLREESPFIGPLYFATEGGLWVDNLGDGRRSAFNGRAELCVKPGSKVGVYAKSCWGLELQSSVDTQLGGYEEFAQDAGIGIRDEVSFVEFGYGHVSSAGIFAPNRGRDFLTLSWGVRY